MAIEITRHLGRPLQDAAEPSAAAGPKSAAGAAAGRTTGGAADKVSFTSSAALLKELEKEVAALPVVDSSRVQAISHALASGTYAVDPARAADKLLAIERALAGKD